MNSSKEENEEVEKFEAKKMIINKDRKKKKAKRRKNNNIIRAANALTQSICEFAVRLLFAQSFVVARIRKHVWLVFVWECLRQRRAVVLARDVKANKFKYDFLRSKRDWILWDRRREWEHKFNC